MYEKKTIIGIITARASESEQRSILGGILSQAEKLGIHTAVFSNIYNFNEYHADVEVENKIYELIESERLDGLILTAESIINPELQTYLFNKFSRSSVPVVITGADIEGFICINNDVKSDMRDIARHLTEVHGFTDIHVLTGYEHLQTSRLRVDGVWEALAEKGIEPKEENVIFGNFWANSGQELAMEYIEGRRKLPQAVICANDYMAYGLIDTFFSHGISVPDDVTVMGYEYTGERIYHSPILSTYYRNRHALGAKAVNILYSMITDTETENISVNGFMVCGDTCSCGTDRKFLGTELDLIRNVQYYNDLNLCGNFEQQLSVCRSISEYIRALQDFSHLIRGVSGIYMCLYENWCGKKGKTSLDDSSNDEIMVMYRIISPEYTSSEPCFFRRGMLFPDELYGAGDKYFLYFVPMFSAGTEIGYFIFQYTSPDTYDKIAIDWVKSAVNALNVLKMKNDIKELLTCHDLSEFHDTITGMFNRKGFFHELENTVIKAAPDDKVCAVLIKTGLFSDDIRIDEKETAVKTDIETAENLKKIAAASGALCAKLSDKQFIIASAGDISEDFCGIIADRITALINHSQTYKSSHNIGSVLTADFVMPVHEYDSEKLSAVLSKKMNEQISAAAEKRKIKGYGKYAELRTKMYRSPELGWNADDVCRDFMLSSGHFRAAYKNIFGISFHRDLILIRIEKAKFLLMTTTLSLSAIAVKCGYEDDKYFLRQFRQLTGKRPNSYRRY